MARTIGIVNLKGGSGKTTTAVNLAACLAEKRKRVLLIDLDPAANATWWLDVAATGRALYEAMLNGHPLKDAIHDTGVPGVDLVPSGDWMIRGEQEITDKRALQRALKALPGKWDYILRH